MSPKRRRRYHRRPRVSARAPGCGCIGCSIPLLIGLAAVVATVLAIAGCSSPSPPVAAPPSPARAVAPPSATAPSAVSPVPGTSDNEYLTGPFTVTFKGIGPLPAQYDAVTMQGAVIPESCAVIDVKNTSNGFTGWVSPSVEFVKGHSLQGQVLGTWPAGPDGGSDGGQSDQLAPGQSEVLYACPEIPGSGKTYVEGQLISVTYGTEGQGAGNATTLQLRY